jgi:nitrite reductase/ring-hydroxylating ferredoxin subunit
MQWAAKIAQPQPQPVERAEAWIEVCPLEEFADGERKVVYLSGQQVALFKVDGNLYALSNRCSHARRWRGQRRAESCTVTRPWHYAQYDLRTGRLWMALPARPVPTYLVEIRDGMVTSAHESAQVQRKGSV